MNDLKPISHDTRVAAPSRDAQAVKDMELKKAVADFESLLISQMLKAMRETVDKDSLFGGGRAEEIYTSMLDDELSRNIASSGGIGLSDILLSQLSASHGMPEKAGVRPLEQLDKIKNYHDASSMPVSAPKAVQAVGDSSLAGGIMKFLQPIAGKISSYFGMRKDPFTGEAQFHRGVDIAAKEGTPIYPAAPGKVIFSGSKGGYGNLVEVRHHDGTITKYGHTSKNIVKQGDTVNPSRPIAYVGSTGRSTGPHLHFEVVKNGGSIDPMSLMHG